MAFKFKSSMAVAAGTFNIYVIQPTWLSQVGLIEGGMKIQFSTDLNRPGFRYEGGSLQGVWTVRPDRVSIESKTFGVDCGTPVSGIIEKLPWTPLNGVGTNLEFEADLAIIDAVNCKLPICDAPGGLSVAQRSWHVGLKKENQIFNYQVSERESPKGDRYVSLVINVHTEIPRGMKQIEASSLAVAACKKFSEHASEAIEVGKELLKVEIQT